MKPCKLKEMYAIIGSNFICFEHRNAFSSSSLLVLSDHFYIWILNGKKKIKI